jgi:hypothetical protein
VKLKTSNKIVVEQREKYYPHTGCTEERITKLVMTTNSKEKSTEYTKYEEINWRHHTIITRTADAA